MTPETQKLIDLLETELGYSDRGNTYTKFGDWYGKNIEFDADYSAAPWCDMYLSWAADKLGYQEWVGQFAWTVAHAEWFEKQDAWGTTPKPGALVFYDWGGSDEIDNIDHVGIVTKVSGDRIHTIEGNIDGGVAKRKERDTSKVVGYGYPDTIKARLDKAAEVDGTLPPEASNPDKLKLPAEDAVSALIQETEAAPPAIAKSAAPKVATSDDKPAKKAEQPAKTANAPAPAPVAQAPKVGKHAKPAAADTNAVTGKPTPSFTDASASSSLPTVDANSLIGPALLAALAVLAIAKTKQMRVRLAPALAAPSTRKPGRRRSTGSRRSRPTATEFTGFTGLSGSLAAKPDLAPGLALATSAPELISRDLTSVTSTPELLTRNLAPATTAPLAASATGGTEFDAFAPRRRRARPTNVGAPVLAAPVYDLFAPEEPTRHAHTTGGTTTSYSTSHPAARSTQSAYRGRRRDREHPVEETTTFQPETTPARGRRHRAAATDEAALQTRSHRTSSTDDAALHTRGHQEPRGRRARTDNHATRVESFTEDTPPRGRRHRSEWAPAQDIVPPSWAEDRELVTSAPSPASAGRTDGSRGRHRA